MVVALDCNIWISLTLTRQIDFIADLSDNGIIIASCEMLRNEITGVLNRPKFGRFLTETTINQVVELHDVVTINHSLGKIPDVVSDPKDNYLFALSAKSKADYLVTGDKLLLAVGKYKKTQLVNLSNFKKIFTPLV